MSTHDFTIRVTVDDKAIESHQGVHSITWPDDPSEWDERDLWNAINEEHATFELRDYEFVK